MSSTTMNLISQIYYSRKVLLEQKKINDFEISGFEQFSINEINTLYNNKQLDIILEKNTENPKTNRKQKIYIKYHIHKMLKVDNVEEMIDEIFNLEELLTKDEINETMKNFLIHIWENDGIFIVAQNLHRLQYNILNHVLVPIHRIMNEEEVDLVKKKFNITNPSQFPKINRFDAVAVVIGIRPGEVCEIKRMSKTSVVSLYYRKCENALL